MGDAGSTALPSVGLALGQFVIQGPLRHTALQGGLRGAVPLVDQLHGPGHVRLRVLFVTARQLST